MIKRPYEDVPELITSVTQSLISDSDEYHKTHCRRLARTLQTLVENFPTGKLLEVGTSQFMPLAIKELPLDLDITVTDFNLDLPSSGTMTCSLNGKSTDVNVVRLNIEEQPLPFEDGTFDIVLLCEVLEHMERDPMFMLSEVNRVTKDGGLLLLTTPNVASSRNIYKILKGIEPYFFMQYHKSRMMYRHNYEYSLPTLREVLRSAGFQGRLWTEDTFEDDVVAMILSLEMIGWKMENIGDNIFAVTRKIRGVIDRYPKEIYVD